MTALVSGIYKDGKIELLETPEGLREGRVRVLVIAEEEPKPAPRYLTFGKYRGDKDPSLEDFEAAGREWEEELDEFYPR
jgi:hypothetical protein